MKRLLTIFLLAALLVTSAAAEEPAVGTINTAPRPMVEEHPVYTQCQLGSVCADALREWAGSDLALVNLGDFGQDLRQGEVTRTDLKAVFPQDRILALAEVTPSQLWLLLEQSVSRVELNLETERVDEEASRYDGFCQISGCTIRYDASAPVGERILAVSLSDGTQLSREDNSSVYTLCASAFLLEGGYGFPVVEAQVLEGSQVDALAAYVAGHSNLPETTQTRIEVVGARSDVVLGVLSTKTVFVGCVLLCALLVFSGRKLGRYRDEYGNVPQ